MRQGYNSQFTPLAIALTELFLISSKRSNAPMEHGIGDSALSTHSIFRKRILLVFRSWGWLRPCSLITVSTMVAGLRTELEMNAKKKLGRVDACEHAAPPL